MQNRIAVREKTVPKCFLDYTRRRKPGSINDGTGWWLQFDCHPEQAFFAQGRIWASRAKGCVFYDPIIARLARFPFKLHHDSARALGTFHAKRFLH